jgi:hypothetical protein
VVRKECVKLEVDEGCAQKGFEKVYVSTIGRIIKTLKEEGTIERLS